MRINLLLLLLLAGQGKPVTSMGMSFVTQLI